MQETEKEIKLDEIMFNCNYYRGICLLNEICNTEIEPMETQNKGNDICTFFIQNTIKNHDGQGNKCLMIETSSKYHILCFNEPFETLRWKL